jgi:hypothetical protein
MGEEAAADLREIHNLYSLPNIIRIIKLRKVRWAEHVAYMGTYKILVRKCERKG